MGLVDRGSLTRIGLYNGHPFHRAWKNMKTRCYNLKSTQYKWYGGKGITVCEEWHSFQNFYKDMFETWSEELTLERRDNDLPYCKDNCIWITRLDSARHRSNVTINLETANVIRRLYATGKFTQTELAIRFDIVQTTISSIINYQIWA